MAPQFAGRDGKPPRPGVISGTAFLPETAPWLKLLSVKQSAEHLYLRYALSKTPESISGQPIAPAPTVTW